MDFLFARVLLHFACFRTWWGGVGWWGRIIHAWVARGRGQGRWDRVGPWMDGYRLNIQKTMENPYF